MNPLDLKQATPALKLILDECIRQTTQEGYDAAHDDKHIRGQIARAAEAYITFSALWCGAEMKGVLKNGGDIWPWDADQFKPRRDPIRNLVKAGALLLAEKNRIHRRIGEIAKEIERLQQEDAK